MSFKWLIGAVAFVAVVAVIFVGGVLVGGSWGSGMAEENHDAQLEQVKKCLPIENEAELKKCLAESEGGS